MSRMIRALGNIGPRSFRLARAFSNVPIAAHGAAVLPYKELRYRAVQMDVENLPVSDTSDFSTRLFATLSHLRAERKTTVYLRVGMLYSHFITAASMFGFKYHHAEGDSCSLILWLPDDVPCSVPPFATHHVGVGAVLLNDKQEILVVKEKSKLAGWKLPGGYVNLGEDIGRAAEREVFEETHIKSRFSSVLSFRHSHNVQWGRGDIYVICKCQPLTTEIKVRIDPSPRLHSFLF